MQASGDTFVGMIFRNDPELIMLLFYWTHRRSPLRLCRYIGLPTKPFSSIPLTIITHIGSYSIFRMQQNKTLSNQLCSGKTCVSQSEYIWFSLHKLSTFFSTRLTLVTFMSTGKWAIIYTYSILHAMMLLDYFHRDSLLILADRPL